MKKSTDKPTTNHTEELDQITKKIIGYEPGDVLSAGEITDRIEKLGQTCRGNETAERICRKLKEEAERVLDDSFGTFAGTVSEGIDLLRSILENEPEVPAGKKKQIELWLSGNTGMQAADTAQAETAEEDPSLIESGQLKLFASDCRERLSTAQDLILKMEADPGDSAAVKELFRIFHTIKGECGFLKLVKLGGLAHTTESLLDRLRTKERTADGQVIGALLKGVDLAQEMTKDLETESFDAYKAVTTDAYGELAAQAASGRQEPAAGGDQGEEKREKTGPSAENGSSTVKKADSDDTVIKVRTGKVNYLVDMIGELLISLGQMKEETEGLPQVRKIARTLQYAGMQLRTESVHALFGTVRRIIRDTEQKVGKEVETVFEGEDLEIDRTLIESLEEPLMHLVRNALDHGIESAEERKAAGKPARGTVRISAERRGNSIVISVGDDGRGLDRQKILKKAVERRLIREADCADMSEAEVNNLIFVSGFSTNESVNLISGRGVGMDIVKEAVAQAKGHIVTESIAGHGTTFSLYFPLSTAIIDGMMTRTGKNIFIIPIASVVESLKAEKEQIHKVTNGVDVLDLRGKMIPVIRIAELFDMEGAGRGDIATVVESEGGSRFALMSDEILAKREVVIKNLGPYFKNLQGISSGTVLSGGSVGFVLDIDELIALGRESGAGTPGSRK